MCLIVPAAVQAGIEGKIAVLPFTIHSLEPQDHLKLGLQEMFSAHLVEKGFTVIDQGVVNAHPMAFLPVFESADALALGRDLGASWVITGSLTQIGQRISLDLRAVDVSESQTPFSIYVVEDDVDRLSGASQAAAGNIYNRIAGVAQIKAIEVRGNKRIEADAILAVIESRKGEALDADRLDQDLRAIYKMGYFNDVSIETLEEAKGKTVVFNVVEKPSVTRMTFSGNEEIKDDELKEEAGIKLYTIFNRNEVRQSINRMKELYRQKGYYNVEITEETEELEHNEISLRYDIKEGEKVYIRNIEFSGNARFDDGDLKDIMETSEKGFLSYFTKSGLLDKKKIEYDVHKLTAFYHNHGYIKAVVGEPEITYEQGKGLTVRIDIQEGVPYGVKAVEIEGELIQPEEELLEKLAIRKEEFFNREVVRQDTLTLRELYANEGYAYADVAPLTREDDENHLVDIVYKVTKGRKVRFERINITGNTVTRDKVIRRELKTVEGEYYSGKDLKRSTENLHRLGFFEDVEVQTKKGTDDDLMLMDIKVKEMPTGAFSLGAGYSSFDKTVGMFDVSQNNLFGRGQRLSASARMGSRTVEYDISFLEPWLFDKRLAAGFDLYKWSREYNEYTKDSFGGSLKLAVPLSLFGEEDYTQIWGRYLYDDAEVADVKPYVSKVIKDQEGRTLTSSVTLGIERNSQDRAWNPTRGSVNVLAFEYAGGFLAGDAAFNRYEGESTWYFPMPWSTVLMVRGWLGEIPKTEFTLDVELVLLAVGFVHAEHGRLVKELGVGTDARGNIETGPGFRTGVEGIYAVGDAATGASLVVRAIDQGRKAANIILTIRGR